MTDWPKLVSAVPTGDYRLKPTYSDGSLEKWIFAETVAKGGIFAFMQDPERFRTVQVAHATALLFNGLTIPGMTSTSAPCPAHGSRGKCREAYGSGIAENGAIDTLSHRQARSGYCGRAGMSSLTLVTSGSAKSRSSCPAFTNIDMKGIEGEAVDAAAAGQTPAASPRPASAAGEARRDRTPSLSAARQ